MEMGATKSGSLLVELAVALLLVTVVSYGMAQYRWQTVASQKEAVVRLQALQAISNLLETCAERGHQYKDGQMTVGTIKLSWHAVDQSPVFDTAPYAALPLQKIVVAAEYELFSPSKKRRLVLCTVLPTRRVKGLP